MAGINKLCTLLVEDELVVEKVIEINRKIKGKNVNILPLSYIRNQPSIRKAVPMIDDCFSLLKEGWVTYKPHHFG